MSNEIDCSKISNFNVALLMVNNQKGIGFRFDLPHIGPAIDIAIEVIRCKISILFFGL